MLRPCVRCGVLVRGGSYCPRHPPKRRNRQTPRRGGGAAARRFRAAVLAKAGHRCEATIDGVRCEETEYLEAHHLRNVRDGGTNEAANGVALCRKHHRQVERTVSGG